MPVPKVLSDDQIYNRLIDEFGQNNDADKRPGRVLISAPYMMPNITSFKRFFEERGHEVIMADVEERLEEEDLEKYAGKYDVAMIGDDRYSPKIVESCGARALCKWGTGIDSIDLAACQKAGIRVHNTPDAFSTPVAESILGAILAFNRTIIQSTNLMRTTNAAESWVKLPGKTIREAKIAIVGMGNVGSELQRLLLAIGAGTVHPIITYDILEERREESRRAGYSNFFGTGTYRASPVGSLQEVLESQPDFLCMTCCQTGENVGMIGEDELKTLPNHTIVINMARGRLIQETALIEALANGQIGGAALDVFWDEPLSEDSPLRTLPNVLLSSHNANSSPEHWLRVHVNTVRNALYYIE